MLSLKAEYGSVDYALYWGMSLDVERKELSVSRGDDASRTLILEQKDIDAFIAEIKRYKLFDLPFTDYSVDHSDDLYHMGVSVRARLGVQLFDHQCPVGIMVMVPTRRPSKEQHFAFVSFVRSVADRAVELSGIAPPDHVLTKWKSRLQADVEV